MAGERSELGSFSPDAELVRETDECLHAWRQGDVALDLGQFTFLADAKRPLTRATAAAGAVAEASSGLAPVLEPHPYGFVVLTQTCDIQRSGGVRPFIEMAPLVQVTDEGVFREAVRGTRPQLAPVPWAHERAFADLTRVVTLEKAALLHVKNTRRWSDPQEVRKFAQAVARRYGRFAFPDDLSTALTKLTTRLKAKTIRNTDEGAALDELEEIRVTAVPSWEAAEIEVFLHFLLPARDDKSALDEDEWANVIEGWLERCEPCGVIKTVDGARQFMDELTAREYLDSDKLDLDHLTTAGP